MALPFFIPGCAGTFPTRRLLHWEGAIIPCIKLFGEIL